VRFAQPVPTVLDPDETAVVVVARQTAPARTWAFRSPDDRAPRTAERYVTRYDLTPTERFVTQGIEPLHVGFELSVFDDLEVLKD